MSIYFALLYSLKNFWKLECSSWSWDVGIFGSWDVLFGVTKAVVESIVCKMLCLFIPLYLAVAKPEKGSFYILAKLFRSLHYI